MIFADLKPGDIFAFLHSNSISTYKGPWVKMEGPKNARRWDGRGSRATRVYVPPTFQVEYTERGSSQPLQLGVQTKRRIREIVVERIRRGRDTDPMFADLWEGCRNFGESESDWLEALGEYLEMLCKRVERQDKKK